jgi:hypothetical protein
MTDDQNKDGKDIVLNVVDDAIVTDPYHVTRAAFEFFIAVRSGIAGQVF